MKVIAINGSPHIKGSTDAAIDIAFEILQREGIETEKIHIGGDANRVCIGCFSCGNQKYPKCIFTDDKVNEVAEKCKNIDGLILGSPVHFAGIAGGMKSFLDRFTHLGANGLLNGKVGMSLVALRRTGASSALDQLNHYFSYAGMPIAASYYWNAIHGMDATEITQDLEGVKVLQTCAQNMAWMIKSFAASGIAPPDREKKVMTNFVR